MNRAFLFSLSFCAIFFCRPDISVAQSQATLSNVSDLEPQTSDLESQTSDLESQASDLESQASDLGPQALTVQWEAADDDDSHNLTETQIQDQSANASAGPRYFLQQIEIQGNFKTLKGVILHYVSVNIGEFFSAGDERIKETKYRLLATGYFSQVSLSLKKGDRRGSAILVIKVLERNTLVLKDIVLGFSEITPYGSIGVADSSFLGTGIQVGGAAVVSNEQVGYKLSIADDHFLNSDVGVHTEGIFMDARDFFGHKNIQVDSDFSNEHYAQMDYKRAGLKVGMGYTMLLDYFFWLDLRFETIHANVPAAGSHSSFGETRPIQFGHLRPGASALVSLLFGFSRDTRNHPLLPSEGSLLDFGIELSTEVFGSDYDFSKFTVGYDYYFPLGKGHSIQLGLFAGLIMGRAPFFNQFFVGDFTSLVPSRVLDLNFSHLHPSVLKTSIQEMRYEDLATSIKLEYALPFYRGEGFVYGINGFASIGIFGLASADDLRTDPEGYRNYKIVPMDLSFDAGIRIDTKVGIFDISFANVIILADDFGNVAE